MPCNSKGRRYNGVMNYSPQIVTAFTSVVIGLFLASIIAPISAATLSPLDAAATCVGNAKRKSDKDFWILTCVGTCDDDAGPCKIWSSGTDSWCGCSATASACCHLVIGFQGILRVDGDCIGCGLTGGCQIYYASESELEATASCN